MKYVPYEQTAEYKAEQERLKNQPPQEEPALDEAPETTAIPAQTLNLGTIESSLRPKMKWFHFVIWIQLFWLAIVGFYNGTQLLSGDIYNEDYGAGFAETVWDYYTGLKTVDWMFGALFILVAVFAIYVRFQLSKYRSNGPKLYIYVLIAQIVVDFGYPLSVAIVTRVFSIDAYITFATQIIINIILICANRVYFGKRKFLFIN